MPNELDRDPQDHVIIFHDKSRRFVTTGQMKIINEALRSSVRSIVSPSLGTLVLSSISKILSLKDYYEQYPDERPEQRNEINIEDDRYKGLTIEQIAMLNENRFAGLLRGLKEYIDQATGRGENPITAIGIFNQKMKQFERSFAKK